MDIQQIDNKAFLGLVATIQIAMKEIEDRLATCPYDDFDHGKNLGLLIAKDMINNRLEGYIKNLEAAKDIYATNIVGQIEWDTVCFADGWKEGYGMGKFDAEKEMRYENGQKNS